MRSSHQCWVRHSVWPPMREPNGAANFLQTSLQFCVPSGHSAALWISYLGAIGTVFGSTGSAAMTPEVAHKNAETVSSNVALRISGPLCRQGYVPRKDGRNVIKRYSQPRVRQPG